MEQSTTIIIRSPWGTKEVIIGNYCLPCGEVYEALLPLQNVDSFHIDRFAPSSIDPDESFYHTMRFVCNELAAANILSFDPGSAHYERGELYDRYWEFFDNYMVTEASRYKVTDATITHISTREVD
jgi:hypothetical protein